MIKGLDEKTQIAVIAKAIEDFRFEDDKSGYYFAYKEYVPVAHPTRKDLLGKSLAEAKDVNGVYYVRELFSTSKRQTDKELLCIIFFLNPCPMARLALLPRLLMRPAMISNTDNIWISTGVYADTFEQSHKRVQHVSLILSALSCVMPL